MQPGCFPKYLCVRLTDRLAFDRFRRLILGHVVLSEDGLAVISVGFGSLREQTGPRTVAGWHQALRMSK
jgi:hypothetical protein